MDKIETKTKSSSDVVDPSSSSVAVAIAKEVSNSTALSHERFHLLSEGETPVQYRLYKRRWCGIVALVRTPRHTRAVDWMPLSRQILLNIVKGMNWVWFGAIANSTAKEFDFTLDQVNWFANAPHLSYLVFSWCVPILVRRLGLRNTVCCFYPQFVALNSIPFAGSLWIRHSCYPLMDTSMRNDQNLIVHRILRCYHGGPAPRGCRCPVFPNRRTKIRGSLVRSEGEGHGDHDCSYLYLSLYLIA